MNTTATYPSLSGGPSSSQAAHRELGPPSSKHSQAKVPALDFLISTTHVGRRWPNTLARRSLPSSTVICGMPMRCVQRSDGCGSGSAR